jgi:large subunit ribosomal protein L13
MATYSAKVGEVERKWHVIDATGKSLGRVATCAATVLRGKHRPTFTPHVDAGDFVIIVNAERVKLTGTKSRTKFHRTHSGFPGGFKEREYGWMLERRPEVIMHRAVSGMLPKGPLGRRLRTKLKVYAGAKHPHAAQKPEVLGVR